MNDALAPLRARAAAAAFPVDGSLRVPGLARPVTIARDERGALLIRAERLDDLWFAQGFATAGERLFQLELAIRASTGRLAEVFGEPALDRDRFVRTIGLHLAGREYVETWTDEDHEMHGRFRAGARAWLEAMPAAPLEYELLGIDPSLPEDPAPWASCLAWLGWQLSNDHDQELLRARIAAAAGREAAEILLPPLPADPPEVVPGAGAAVGGAGRGLGSNAWAVAGARTASGAPLLANDPHLLALHPSPWVELGCSAPGYEVRGVALPFAPGVVIGATPHHAWGITNTSGDVQDLFVERLSPDGSAAAFRERWEPVVVREEAIAVRGEPEPRRHVVRETRHGPILEVAELGLLSPTLVPTEPPAGHAYALAWVGRRRGLRPSLARRAATASSFAAFRSAVVELDCPGQNFVYADVEGTIGFQCTGAYPIRARGDGTWPVPGWDGEHEWVGWIPSEALPWSVDPAHGFLVSANHRPHDDTYPYLISSDFHEPHRARRIAALLAARTDHDVASMLAIQRDTRSLPMRRLVPLLLAAVGSRASGRRGDALDRLRRWGGDLDAASGPAAIANAWVAAIGRRILEPWLGEEPARAYLAWRERWVSGALPALLEAGHPRADRATLLGALDDALAELERALGPDPATWSWGALHRLTLAHPLAQIPGLEPLFTAASVPVGGDEQTVSQTGIDGTRGYAAAVVASWRAVFDLAHPDRSVGTLAAGNSGNPASPHWNDQLADYLAGRGHRLRFGRTAEDGLRLEP